MSSHLALGCCTFIRICFVNGTNWVLSTATNNGNIYRTNGIYRQYTGVSATVTETSFNINRHPSSGSKTGGWLVAEIIIYNRILNQNEIFSVEDYLNDKYSIYDSERAPYLDDLRAYYTAESYNINDKIWYDRTLNYRHTINTDGSPQLVDFTFTNGKTYKVIKGTENDKITFPNNVLANDNTFIVLSKYDVNASPKRRIIDGFNQNWLVGHWGGKSGICYMNGWVPANQDVQKQTKIKKKYFLILLISTLIFFFAFCFCKW